MTPPWSAVVASEASLQVTGMRELLYTLHALQGKELAKVLGSSLKSAVDREAKARAKAEVAADIKKPGSHRGPPGNPGKTGPMVKSVRSRKLRTRSGEIVAYSLQPRAWYAGLRTRGVRPHRIEPKDGRALNFGGGFFSAVDHPGHGGSDWAIRAAAGAGPRIRTRMVDDLAKHVAKAARKR